MTTTNGQPDRGPRPVCANDKCENLAEPHSHGWRKLCRSCRRKADKARHVEEVAGPLREWVACLERMTEAGDRTISNLCAEIEAADAALKVVREERDGLQVTVDRLTADRNELTRQNGEMREVLIQVRQERDEVRALLVECGYCGNPIGPNGGGHSSACYETMINAVKAERGAAQQEAERLADALAQMNAAVGRVEEERDDALTERDAARDALDSMAERAADLMTRLRWSWGVSGVLAFGLLVIALRMWGVL